MFIEIALLASGAGAFYKYISGQTEDDLIKALEDCRDLIERSGKSPYSFKQLSVPIEQSLADITRIVQPGSKHDAMVTVLRKEWRAVQAQAKRFTNDSDSQDPLAYV